MTKKAKESLPFYHTEAWKRVRELVLQRDQGMCRDCMREMELGYGMKPRRATLVHHIQPLREHPELALDPDNLISLCPRHHEEKHAERREREKQVEEPKMRVIKA